MLDILNICLGAAPQGVGRRQPAAALKAGSGMSLFENNHRYMPTYKIGI